LLKKFKKKDYQTQPIIQIINQNILLFINIYQTNIIFYNNIRKPPIIPIKAYPYLAKAKVVKASGKALPIPRIVRP